MVRWAGFEPAMFTLWDWFYRPTRNRHLRSQRIIKLVAEVGLEPTLILVYETSE